MQLWKKCIILNFSIEIYSCLHHLYTAEKNLMIFTHFNLKNVVINLLFNSRQFNHWDECWYSLYSTAKLHFFYWSYPDNWTMFAEEWILQTDSSQFKSWLTISPFAFLKVIRGRFLKLGICDLHWVGDLQTKTFMCCHLDWNIWLTIQGVPDIMLVAT